MYTVQPYVAPIKGTRYNMGGTLIDDLEMTDSSNMNVTRLMNIGKRVGYAPKGDTLPLTGIVLGIDQFYKADGSEYLVILTDEKAYYLLNGVWTDITPLATDFTGTYKDKWSMEIMNDMHIIANGVNVVYKWTGSGEYESLDGSPPVCKYLKKYHDYLVMGYTIEAGDDKPQRVRWCDTGLPESWTVGAGSNAGYVDLADGVDQIQGLEILGDRLVVIKERSLYSGYLTGTSDIFRFDLIINGTGAHAGFTVQNVKNDIYFLGNDNVYAFNGLTVTAIGDQIKDKLFAESNPENLIYAHSLVVEELDEYRLYIPTGTSLYPTMEYRYNYAKQAWFPGTRTNVTRAGYFQKQTSNTWDNLVGTWDSQTLTWNDRWYLANSPTNLYGDSDGYVYEEDQTLSTDDDDAYTGYFDTKDFTMTEWSMDKFWARLDVMGQGVGCDVYYSTDEGALWNSIGTITFGSTFTPQKLDFRVSSFRIRFRFSNPRAELFEIRQMLLYYDKAGRI